MWGQVLAVLPLRARSEKTSSRRARMPVLLTAILGIVATLLFPVPPAIAAEPSEGFQPGNIISDANFYDGNALSAVQVQQLLNEKVPRCTIGDSGRAPGSTWGNTKIADSCVQNLNVATPTRAADRYCATYVGASRESAAQIIAKVGKACGISQKVLLVMLQKEQALISDSWPTVMQLDWAMGYACPDTAPCDSMYKGFFNQVYKAAWQLKVYKAYPASYRYQPHRSNEIFWHPNSSCGVSHVYIENLATAALYIYTPYRPNQAALNAGWGTGDSCSSYGNRNFYNYFKDWFGTTQSYTVHASLVAEYETLGSAGSFLGRPTSQATIYPDGGVGQGFEGGSMYWSPRSAASAVNGPIRSYFWSNGSTTGWLGYPNGRLTQYSDGGMGQAFRNASVYWSQATGAHGVKGEIRSAYWASGSMQGPLGYPKGLETIYSDGGKGQGFQYGSIYWSSATGGHYVQGAVRQYYWSNGSAQGRLGYPVSDPVADGKLILQQFSGGHVISNQAGRTATVDDVILEGFERAGGGEVLGAPTGEKGVYPDGGVGQGFESGSVYGAEGQPAFAVSGLIRKHYWDNGSSSGSLGYPAGDLVRISETVAWQKFSHGSVVSNFNKATPVLGSFDRRYEELGRMDSNLGLPLAAAGSYADGGAGQGFEGGSMYQRPGGDAVEVVGNIRQQFWDAGSISGRYGYPISAAACDEAGCVQEFERGTIFSR